MSQYGSTPAQLQVRVNIDLERMIGPRKGVRMPCTLLPSIFPTSPAQSVLLPAPVAALFHLPPPHPVHPGFVPLPTGLNCIAVHLLV